PANFQAKSMLPGGSRRMELRELPRGRSEQNHRVVLDWNVVMHDPPHSHHFAEFSDKKAEKVEHVKPLIEEYSTTADRGIVAPRSVVIVAASLAINAPQGQDLSHCTGIDYGFGVRNPGMVSVVESKNQFET